MKTIVVVFNSNEKANKKPLRFDFSFMVGGSRQVKTMKRVERNVHLWFGRADYGARWMATLVPRWHLFLVPLERPQVGHFTCKKE